jgi:multiple antibiotic resistance protein
MPPATEPAPRERGPARILRGLIVLATLWTAPKIASMLGKTGMNVITRIMGLVIFAIAVEFIARGLAELFPSLGHAV